MNRSYRRRRTPTSSSAAFAPLSVGTPLVWYDLGVCTQGAGIVTALPDQSVNGNDAVFTGGEEPTYTATNAGFNNLPTANFPDAGTKRFSTPDLGLTTGAVTFVIVANSNPASGNAYIFSASNAMGEVFYSQGALATEGSNDDGTTLLPGAGCTTASVIVYIANGASSKLYVSAYTPSTGAAGAQDLTLQTVRLGHYGGGVSGVGAWAQAGSTAHFLVYNGAMAQADVEYLLDGFGGLAGISIGA